MMAELIDRRRLKAEMRELLADAQASPKMMTVLYMGLVLALSLVESFVQSGFLSTFISILVSLMGMVLTAGFALYCMAIRRGERAELLTIFDGFSFVGKILALNIVIYLLIWGWSLLMIVPGIIAGYRYRFALYNLYENPDMGIMAALEMSKRQTVGYKAQLLSLDLSYLGWNLLVSLPNFLYATSALPEIAQTAMNYTGVGTISALSSGISVEMLPSWAWILILGLWQILVCMFYLPNQQCVELGYFEIAKQTSGIGAGTASGNYSRGYGPDNMGGF